MSPAIHLLLVIDTIVAAASASMYADITPSTIVSVTAAIVGVLLYLRPFDLIHNPAGTDRSVAAGGNDAG